MPIYEYRCEGCRAKFSLLIGMVAEPDEEKCPKCGSLEVQKLVSRFRRGRTEDDRLDEVTDRLDRIGEPESYQEMRSLVRDIGSASDDEFADDLEEMFEEDISEDGAA